jgi:hypothetical protein
MSGLSSDEGEVHGIWDRVAVNFMYKPIGLIASVVGGLLASMAFARLWRAIGGKGKAPEATDEAQSWADILPAAALHGIVFGVVKALVDRAGAKQFERMTGIWPGKQRSHAEADAQT